MALKKVKIPHVVHNIVHVICKQQKISTYTNQFYNISTLYVYREGGQSTCNNSNKRQFTAATSFRATFFHPIPPPLMIHILTAIGLVAAVIVGIFQFPKQSMLIRAHQTGSEHKEISYDAFLIAQSSSNRRVIFEYF